MSKEQIQREITQILQEALPDVELREPRRVRAGGPELWDIVYSTILFASSVGAFGGLWKVCQLIVQRHASVKVEVSYDAEHGKKVKVEYTNRTAAEAGAIMSEYPPAAGTPVLFIATNPRTDSMTK